MANVCILTDSTAQFPQSEFPGKDRVHLIPFGISSDSLQGDDKRYFGNPVRRLNPPTTQEFIRLYTRLGRDYDTILVILLSTNLYQCFNNALSASTQYSNHTTISVIDSQTTSIGLGYLVQLAAAAASAGVNHTEIERLLRESIPRIYMLICIPEITTLANSGHLEYSQAMIGEMIGLLPIFTIEDGCLTPVKKIRSQRHLCESFLEYINEFDAPSHVVLIQGGDHHLVRSRAIRQVVQETFPDTSYSEHIISPYLEVLFGTQSIGLVIIDRADQRQS